MTNRLFRRGKISFEFEPFRRMVHCVGDNDFIARLQLVHFEFGDDRSAWVHLQQLALVAVAFI